MNKPKHLKIYYRERKERSNEEYFAIFELFMPLESLLGGDNIEVIGAELYDKDYLPYKATIYKPDEK